MQQTHAWEMWEVIKGVGERRGDEESFTKGNATEL